MATSRGSFGSHRPGQLARSHADADGSTSLPPIAHQSKACLGGGFTASHAENANKAAEYVRLFEVDFDKIRGFSFDVLDGLTKVGYLQIRGKRHLPVEPFSVNAQTLLLGSAQVWNGNGRTRSLRSPRETEAAGGGLASAPSAASLGMARSAIR